MIGNEVCLLESENIENVDIDEFKTNLLSDQRFVNNDVNDAQLAREAFVKRCSDKNSMSWTMVRDSERPFGEQRLTFDENILCTELNPSSGINIPTWYLAECGSGTMVHLEDGEFSSFNLNLWRGMKAWMIIHPDYVKKFAEKFSCYITRDGNCGSKRCKNSGGKCNLCVCIKRVYHRPGLLVSPDVLDQNGICYSLFIQRPGDLIYVGCGVPHAVVNISANIAVALNFTDWHRSARNRRESFCACSEDLTRRSRLELAMPLMSVKVLKSASILCSQCEFLPTFLTKADLKFHQSQHHRFPCRQCNLTFSSDINLRVHVKGIHEKSLRIRCTVCNIELVHKKNLVVHMLKVHSEKVTCSVCNREFKVANMLMHKKNCVKNVCACGKIFINLVRYNNHIVKCKKKINE